MSINIVKLYLHIDNTIPKKSTRQENPHQADFSIHTLNKQKQPISARISNLAEKFISKEKDIYLDTHWNNESGVKDKATVAEDKMYQDWSL